MYLVDMITYVITVLTSLVAVFIAYRIIKYAMLRRYPPDIRELIVRREKIIKVIRKAVTSKYLTNPEPINDMLHTLADINKRLLEEVYEWREVGNE